MTIARVALPVATPGLFDYWLPAGVDAGPGAIVRVRLGARRVVGVVAGIADESGVAPDRLVPVDEVVAVPPLPTDVCELCTFIAGYYQASPGLAFALATPPLAAPTRSASFDAPVALTEQGRARLPSTLARAPAARALYESLAGGGLAPGSIATLSPRARTLLRRWLASGDVAVSAPAAPERSTPPLNEDQARAADAIAQARGRFETLVLQGVTGSGKTEVYLAAAENSISQGGQVLMLVPEINLTPQLVARVERALPGARTVSLHSALPDGERARNWRTAAEGRADVVLGTRLAIFTPMPRLDLIVVDEEHDGSYKQQDGVRYHARDAALWRARRRDVRVVLGSATPSLETCANADAGRYRRLTLPRRADPRASQPAVRFVPTRGDDVQDGLSRTLVEAIRQRIARGEQSLVFVNRRGYAPSLKCVACAWEAHCPRCSARLVTHRVPAALVCHHCAHRERIPRDCPACGNVDLAPAGYGTQRLEATLGERFPDARIARVDRDTTRRRGAFEAMRSDVEENRLDLLVGTQMLAKGHDFARLTLVGVVGADNALYSADFRATERLAALLVQVAGRAGRAALPGEVIVQTDFPQHPLYAALARHDFDAFAQTLLDERRAAGLPPFAHLALLVAEAHQREDVDAFLADAHRVARLAQPARDGSVEVFAPVAAPLARRAGYERGQMLVRSERRGELKRVLDGLRGALEAGASRRVRWAIDVDPSSLA